MSIMERLVMLLVLAGFLPAWESIVVQGRPGEMAEDDVPLGMFKFDIGDSIFPYHLWPLYQNDGVQQQNNEDIFSSLPILETPLNGLSLLNPVTSWQMFPSQGGISSSSAILTGPGTISGSSGPYGSLVTGTGNWNAFAPIQPLQGTAPNSMPVNKNTSSMVFFPAQGGVSSSHAVLTGPGTISGSSGPDGSFVIGTGNWSAHSSLQQQNDTSGDKTASSVVLIPSQGGVPSYKSGLKGTGSISGYSGPVRSLVTGTGDWQVFPPNLGSTGIKGLTQNSVEGFVMPMAYPNALDSSHSLSPEFIPYNNIFQTVPLIYWL
ncbi:uncharacterized protein [Palaemon carinicauda]|uniref:uncharacterized protein n=1 Tax=Palaemon carinicauda TaxID=392227 RepID=UPI0035B5E443